MAFPQLSIGDLVAKVPVIQGGMGVGISLHRLAAAVASEGGIGVTPSFILSPVKRKTPRLPTSVH